VVLVGALFKAHPKMVDTYSYGALAGKAVLFFPEAIVVVMFPRVSELRAKGESTRRVLFLSLAAVIVMVGAVAGFFALFPDFTAKVFGGDNWRSLVSPVNNGLFGLKFVVLFGLVMAIFSLCRLLAMYHLAMERKWFIATYLIAAAVEIAGIFVFHDKLSDVLTVMLCVGVVLLAINLALALFESSPHEGSAGVQGEAGIAD